VFPAAADAASQEGIMIRITNVRAVGLRAADSGGTSDPYVVITAGKDTARTPVIQKTLDPVWTDFETKLGLKQDVTKLDKIELQVFDEDKFSLRDDDLGTVTIPVDSLWKARNAPQHIAQDILYEGVVHGMLYFDVQVLGNLTALLASGAGTGLPNCLRVTVVAGHGLEGKHTYDPYVTLTLQKLQYKTKVVEV
jgi:Ca2+-dependent lipid-binding protein